MKWQATTNANMPRYCEIVEDPSAGFYLYVFEDNKCIRDYLQDTLEIAIDCAWEDFGIPKAAWKKVKE